MRLENANKKEKKGLDAPEYIVSRNKIAILLASYNGQEYIFEQLESLHNQTCKDFICFIHDDGSSDETERIIEKYCRYDPEHFIYLGSSKTGGAKYNFLYMLSKIDADFIMFCDQDDVWRPDKIEITFREMLKHNNDLIPIAVCSDVMVVNEHLNLINDSFHDFCAIDPGRTQLIDLLYQNISPGCTMMINRKLGEITLSVDVTELIYMHDWHMMLIAAAYGEVHVIKESLMYYRQHEDNTVGTKGKKNPIQKIRGLIAVSDWLSEKKDYLNVRKNNAEALLKVIEDHSGDLNGKSAVVVKKFLKQQQAPLAFRLMKFYQWKYLGSRG